MKTAVLILSMFTATLMTNAQITVSGFSKEVSCEIGFTEELPHPVAVSTCGKVKTTISEEAFSGGCAGTLVRTFNYSDDCGNTASAQQFIRLLDSESPVLLGVPENISLSTETVPPVPQVIAIDNSKEMLQVVFSEEKGDHVIIRRWTTKDNCENKAEAEQRIFLPVKK